MSANRQIRWQYLADATGVLEANRQVEQSFNNAGRAAQASAGVQKVALNNAERAVLGARAELARMNQVIVNTSQTQGRNNAVVQQMRNEYQQLAAAARVTAANKAVLAAQIAESSGAFSALTTRITVGRGALQGYDAAIEGIVRAFGGITIAWSLAIGLGSQLIPIFLRMVSGKKELVEVAEKEVEHFGQLVRVYRELIDVGSQFAASQAGLARQAELQIIIQGKYNDVISNFRATMKDYDSAIKSARGELTTWQSILRILSNDLLTEAGIVSSLGVSTDDFARKAATLSFTLNEQVAILHALSKAQGDNIETLRQRIFFTTQDVETAQRLLAVLDELILKEESLAAQREAERKAKEAAREAERLERERADTLINLENQAARARIQVIQDEFDRRRALANQEFEEEKARLERRNVLNEVMLNILRTIRFSKLIDINNDEVKHLQELQKKRDDAALKEFRQLIDHQERIRQQENRWREQRERDEQRGLDNLLRIIIQRNRDITQGVEAEIRERERRIEQLRKQFTEPDRRGGGGAIPGLRVDVDAAKLDEIRQTMDRLGVSIRGLDEIFGEAGTTVEQFEQQLRTLEKYQQGDILGGLKESMRGLLGLFNLAMTAAEAFAFALQEAFVQAIAYGKSFIEVFGKTLLAGILNAIGQQAIAEGTYHVLAGTAKLFNPFTAAAGAKEIAAGLALIAFGSSLVAAATALTASLRDTKQAAAAGGGGATGGAAAEEPRREREPTRIPFPTSGPDERTDRAGLLRPPVQPVVIEQTVYLQLDSTGTQNFLDGKQVVTVPNAKGQHNESLRRALRVGFKG